MDDGVVYFRSQVNRKTGPGEDTVLFEKYVGNSATVEYSRNLVNDNHANITYRTRSSTSETGGTHGWCPSTRSEYMTCLHQGKAVVMNPAWGPQ